MMPHLATAAQGTPNATELIDTLTIDLSGEPDSIVPAIAYAPRDWSIVHAIHDSIVQFGPNGEIVPLAAESVTYVDDTTIEITLRSGLTFHDGSPVTSAAITRGVAHIQSADSLVIDLFSAITEVHEIDELTAHIATSAPAPALLAQMVSWFVLLPEGATTDTLATSPIGTGPYRFVSHTSGSEIVLARNPDYPWGSPKGSPIAEQVTYRFVPESSTRVADLASGDADIVIEIPEDQRDAIAGNGGTPVDAPLVGVSFIRLITDEAPFDDARVRQALNMAVDVQGIAEALVSPAATRLASIFPGPAAMGYDPDLAPFAYDPDAAKALLAEAGYADGFDTTFDITTAARQDVAEAIVAQLAEIGVNVTINVAEYADFNATYKDGTAPLRMITWSPLYDPDTLLSLVFARDGYLSRYTSDEADQLIAQAASETDAEARAALYRQLGQVMVDDPAAIYLYNSTELYGVSARAAAWAPRGDEWVLPLAASSEAP